MSTLEVAKAPASKGMAGMVIADSSVSYVDGTRGILEYRGHDIRQLAEHSNFEEVAYLLWNRHLPTREQLETMKAENQDCRPLPPEIITVFRHDPA